MREARLKPLLGEFEAHFDELREGLIDELTYYEGQLKKHANALPQWLALDFKIIWPLFRFDNDSIAPGGALGPRVVAVAAGWLEEHLLTWMGTTDDPVIIQFAQDEERIESYNQAHEDIGAELEQLLLLSENVAGQAKRTLNQWRDDILAELEQQRVEDIEAIEKLVADGDLDPGRDARKEIALLWEDQRRMASTLLKLWEPFDELASHGLELVRDGIEHLQEVLVDVHEGMCEIYPPLQDDYTGESIIPTSSKTDPFILDDSKDAQPHVSPEHLLLIQPKKGKPTKAATDGFELDVEMGFDPYGDTSTSENDDADDYDMPFEFDEDFDDTPIVDSKPLPPISLDIDEPGPTLPMMLDDSEPHDDIAPLNAPHPMIDFNQETPPELFLSPDQPPAQSLDQSVDTPTHVTEPPAFAFELDLEADSQLAQTPEPIPTADAHDEPDDLNPTSDVEDARVETLLTITADELRAPMDDEDEDIDERHQDMDAQSDELDGIPTQPPRRSPEALDAPSEDIEEDVLDDSTHDEVDDEEPPQDEPPTTTSIGTRPGWSREPIITVGKRAMEQVLPLKTGVFFLAFLLPLLVIIGTLVVSGIARVNPNVPNPLIPSPNVFHFVGIALLIWLCICPLTMRWQITWRGWRPRLWHRVPVREEADLGIYREHLELAHWLMPWSEIEEYSLRRWEDLQTGMRGWILELTFERQNHQFSAIAKDEEAWKKTRAPLMPYSQEAWRVSETTFHNLLDAFGLDV